MNTDQTTTAHCTVLSYRYYFLYDIDITPCNCRCLVFTFTASTLMNPA